MTHETHTICNKRMKQKGEKNCCFCKPHSHCEFRSKTENGSVETPELPSNLDAIRSKLEDKECGYMILTPSPLHNGGMTCAEKVPCKYHSKVEEFKCKIDSHLPTEDGLACECGYFIQNRKGDEYIKQVRDTISNFMNFKKDLIQIVLEDVPHEHQERLLKALDIKTNHNWENIRVIPPNATRHGEDLRVAHSEALNKLDPNIPWDEQCLCEDYLKNKFCSHIQKPDCDGECKHNMGKDAVEPSEWENEF